METARAAAGYVPSHVVMFNGTYGTPGVSDWLASWGFTRRWDIFHAHFEVDRELQARVWVGCCSALHTPGCQIGCMDHNAMSLIGYDQ